MQYNCKDEKYKKGVHIVVVSCRKNSHLCQNICSAENPTCSINHRDDVFHCVRVKRLKLYPPTALFCEGISKSKNSSIKFDSPDPADKKNNWKRSRQKVDDSYSVNDVKIMSEDYGFSVIDTEVTVEWPHPGIPNTISTKIWVEGY